MMREDEKNAPGITGQEITFGFFEDVMHLKEVQAALGRTSYPTFGFFEDVMHLKEVQVALGRTSYGQCHKEQNLQSKTGHCDGLSKEEICRTWQDAWIIPGATIKKDPNISQKLQSMR